MGEPVDVSLNCTCSGAVPEVGVPENWAVTPAGGGEPPSDRKRCQ